MLTRFRSFLTANCGEAFNLTWIQSDFNKLDMAATMSFLMVRKDIIKSENAL